MLIKSIKVQNLLSFGPVAQELELHPFNCLIGPNGSGKSSLIMALRLLRNHFAKINYEDMAHYLYKGVDNPEALIEVVVSLPQQADLLYSIGFRDDHGIVIVITHERIEREGKRIYERDADDVGFSILEPSNKDRWTAEQASLSDAFSRIVIYNYDADGMPYYFRLHTDLGRVLHRLCNDGESKAKLLESLDNVAEGITDISTVIEESNQVEVLIHEGDYTIPVARMSSGISKALCLLAILHNPKPPPLVCIENPGASLHTDMLPKTVDWLVEASDRMQLIVTTHSDIMVDALTPNYTDVVVAERTRHGSTLARLTQKTAGKWLDADYTLGELWTSGHFGGNRW